jgi:hypothetical protein
MINPTNSKTPARWQGSHQVNQLAARASGAVSALTGLEATVGLVDHIGATMAANHLAITVTSLEALEAVADLHGKFRC